MVGIEHGHGKEGTLHSNRSNVQEENAPKSKAPARADPANAPACCDPPVRQMQMRIDIVIVYGILLTWSPGDTRSQFGL
ncbi:MAG: hypothetical protein M3495_11870 [Pseudomonadota bacterium]|nr:hypothetical protein [Pseudomonadota bacterium]